MTEIQELLDHINSAVDWYPIRDKVIEVAPSIFPCPEVPEVQDDPTPILCVAYYLTCDCGAPVMVRIEELGSEPFHLVGTEYMETCYECGVVSSD